jgi:hypothetical protein
LGIHTSLFLSLLKEDIKLKGKRFSNLAPDASSGESGPRCDCKQTDSRRTVFEICSQNKDRAQGLQPCELVANAIEARASLWRADSKEGKAWVPTQG